jgi:hypothetical protein
MKIIPNFENYSVTMSGRVINNTTKKCKKPSDNHSGKGYLYVDLYNNGKRKRFYIHRLVAELYIPNPENKPYVNHKDGNPRNNCVENLEWCTPLGNVEHASGVLGVMKAYKKANCKRQKAVQQIDCKTKKVVAVYSSMREAERKTGINSSYICQICKGKFKQCFGYMWCYVERSNENGE